MADQPDLSGIKSYLRRTKTVAELKALADQCFAGGATEEITFTSQSYEGGTATGVLNAPKKDVLRVVEEILAEAGEVPLTGGRTLFSYPDYSGQTSRT